MNIALKKRYVFYSNHYQSLIILNASFRIKLIESNENHGLTKRYELHLQTTLHLSSKNFQPILKTFKLSGVCLRPLLTVRAKNVASKAWLVNKSSLEFRSQYSETRKAETTQVKLSKQRAWKQFGERSDLTGQTMISEWQRKYSG